MLYNIYMHVDFQHLKKVNKIPQNTIFNVINILIKKNLHGIYNLGTKDGMSKKEFALYFCEKVNLDTKNIAGNSIDEVDLIAKRPKDMRLNSEKLENDSLSCFSKEESEDFKNLVKTRIIKTNNILKTSNFNYNLDVVFKPNVEASSFSIGFYIGEQSENWFIQVNSIKIQQREQPNRYNALDEVCNQLDNTSSDLPVV